MIIRANFAFNFFWTNNFAELIIVSMKKDRLQNPLST
jgi:hypothetical protein